jgi:hypothetical protein
VGLYATYLGLFQKRFQNVFHADHILSVGF